MATLLQTEVTEFHKQEKLSDNGAWIYRQIGADPRIPMVMSAVLVDTELFEKIDGADIIHVSIEWSGKEKT